MDRQKYVFNQVTSLTAVAVGKPGHRTFYIVLGEGESWVRVWLEKQELQTLSTVIAETLEIIVLGGDRSSLADGERAPEVLFEPSLSPVGDFKLSRLAVGYDEATDRLGLFVYAPDAENDNPSAIGWITASQALTFKEKIDEICAAGRPPCRLCGGPVDPEGHVCPKSNGHGSIVL